MPWSHMIKIPFKITLENFSYFSSSIFIGINTITNLDFINPFYSISIALWIKGVPAIGLIEAPELGERYVAILGKGAYLINIASKKKMKARVSSVRALSQSYIVTCEGGDQAELLVKNFSKLYPRVKDMRKLGSAAIELAWVGLGRAEVYITPLANIWDIGAGILFVTEAGGKVLDFHQKPLLYAKVLKNQKTDLIAINKKLKLPRIFIR